MNSDYNINIATEIDALQKKIIGLQGELMKAEGALSVFVGLQRQGFDQIKKDGKSKQERLYDNDI